MKVLLMQNFQTAATVLTHRLPHSAKPHARILPPAVADAAALRETVWINDRKLPFRDAPVPITDAQIQDAEDRLRRFAPYIAAAFPETGDGLIESPFQEIPRMREWISRHEGTVLQGRLFLKRDSDLAVSGSVKARGGIYEVLKHAESLAVGAGLLRTTDDYSVLMEPRFREFFSQSSAFMSLCICLWMRDSGRRICSGSAAQRSSNTRRTTPMP